MSPVGEFVTFPVVVIIYKTYGNSVGKLFKSALSLALFNVGEISVFILPTLEELFCENTVFIGNTTLFIQNIRRNKS